MQTGLARQDQISAVPKQEAKQQVELSLKHSSDYELDGHRGVLGFAVGVSAQGYLLTPY